MAKAKYQLGDFLALVDSDDRSFVLAVHEMLLQDNCKPKIQVTKSTGLQLSYSQPKIKTAAGVILIFFVYEDKLMIRIYGVNHKAYPDVLNRLPEKMVHQIDNAADCIKFADPQRCWKGCRGYDFEIAEKHYQKCLVQCFQFCVDAESIPHLMALITNELRERVTALRSSLTF